MDVSDFQEQYENMLVGSSALLDAADALALASKVDRLVLLVDMHRCGRPALRESREVMSLLPCRKLRAEQ